MPDIINNIEQVKRKIVLSAKKSNRNPQKIKLVAVSKTVDSDEVLMAYKAGIYDFGENRAQEIKNKFKDISDPIRWHFIGNLQSNKVKYIIDKVTMIHSLERYSLANEIDKQAKKINKIVNVLVQVNVAEEETKSGINVKEAESFIREIANAFSNIRIKGFMTIAPHVVDPEEARPVFGELRDLFINIKKKNYTGVDMEYLSMGMTNDYTVAIEEGANIVRIGTAIFGSRNKLEV